MSAPKKKKLPAHRPRRDPTALRVVRSYSVHPTSDEWLRGEAARTGESPGMVLDRLIAAARAAG